MPRVRFGPGVHIAKGGQLGRQTGQARGQHIPDPVDTNHSSGDGRVERGNRTRRAVLRHAVDIASVDGLDGLSIGRLASELGHSKSGIFALFGSKEELQVATVHEAVRLYESYVVEPARTTEAGLQRVWRLAELWFDYSRSRVFPGGCFFFGVSAEVDARPGPVRDAVGAARSAWVGYLAHQLELGRRAGTLRPEVDIDQTVFEITAFLEASNGASLLHDDDVAYDRAAKAVLRVLREASAHPDRLPLAPR